MCQEAAHGHGTRTDSDECEHAQTGGFVVQIAVDADQDAAKRRDASRSSISSQASRVE